ncbi:major facilitator superfamily domain-containing protein [Xylaria sp. FL1777]|nr:major facilitator superfamily domain-containing protein [Xylaria sp. FL1777]
MDNDSDKGAFTFEQVEKIEAGPPSEQSEFTEREGKKIISRIDRRLLVTIGFMYCVSLIDRTNISLAAIAGLTKDLVLTGNRYSVATLAFFPTYIVFQPAATVLIRKLGPRFHLSFVTAAWGAAILGLGFVKTYGQLTALRVITGIFEAGFFPAAAYLLSTWYTRYELGRRFAIFYLIGSTTSGFSGILAFGIIHLEGAGGLRGWRWIFIIEGLLTIVLGVAGYFLLVNFPDSNRKNLGFLSEKQRAWIVNRVNADRGDAVPSKFNLVKYLKAGLDWRIWAYALIAFGSTTIAYALAFFFPIILNQKLGFDVGTSQALVAPPYVFAGILTYAVGWLGDRYRIRAIPVIINMLFCIVGLPLLFIHPDPKIEYFGAFLLLAGANSNVPTALGYQATNIRGQWKRAFASATYVGSGAIGGIAGSLVFREQDRPEYKPGFWACLAVTLLNIVLVGILTISFYIDNKKADRGEKELEAEEDGPQADFRYTY